MAKKPKVDLPNLDNATPGFIVDELGRIREEMSRLKTLEGYYKQALQGRRADGQNAISGTLFDALISEETQIRVSSDKVRNYFAADAEGLASVCDEISFQVIRTTRKTEAGA
jgi:hypothetical protein